MKDPQLLQFLKKYEQAPQSKIFAPLAECYRKAGLVHEAIRISTEGLKVHPHFVSGKVALARALFDDSQFEQVLHWIQPVIEQCPENLMAQELWANAQLQLGNLPQALSSFKILLLFNPQHPNWIEKVQSLELKLSNQNPSFICSPIEQFNIESVPTIGAQLKNKQIQNTKTTQKKEVAKKLTHLLQKIERYKIKNKPL